MKSYCSKCEAVDVEINREHSEADFVIIRFSCPKARRPDIGQEMDPGPAVN